MSAEADAKEVQEQVPAEEAAEESRDSVVSENELVFILFDSDSAVVKRSDASKTTLRSVENNTDSVPLARRQRECLRSPSNPCYLACLVGRGPAAALCCCQTATHRMDGIR